MDLFDQDSKSRPEAGTNDRAPLAARMRPRTLEDIAGQQHILGDGKLLRRAIEADRLGSVILYGPPGCGKTSLAEVIARVTRRRFERTSGVMANVATLRELLEAAQTRNKIRREETILFIDEIHRFNKAQQDVLLPYVEEGAVTLIGATTHNPFFFINSPLTSRSQIFQLEPIREADIVTLLQRAITHPDGLGYLTIKADDDALAHLAAVCEGDARRALNALEIAALTTKPSEDGVIHITRSVTEESVQTKAVVYDHDEDGHYDTISAFIKSVRGSDPDAAVFWLAKMVLAGEDARFIARRLVILASEDVGNADPIALVVAQAAAQAAELLGWPEAELTLSQATLYLAMAPKSNAALKAINAAKTAISEGANTEVPLHLRNASFGGARGLGYGRGYAYPHDHPGHWVRQQYLPEGVDGPFYHPSDQGYEAKHQTRLEGRRTSADDEE